MFEMEAFSKGTFAIAKTLAEITKKVRQIFSVVHLLPRVCNALVGLALLHPSLQCFNSVSGLYI